MLAFSPLYLLPTLLPERTTPPGNGRMTPGTSRIAATAASAAASACRLRLAEDQEVAAADALHRAERLLAEELAVHRRHAPVALAVEQLADLPAVAEVAQAPPTLIVLPGSPASPLKHAVVAQVSTHWATRLTDGFLEMRRG